MFVSQSTYAQEVRKRIHAEMELAELTSMYNRLIERINRLGGENFLQDATLDKKNEQFDRSELNVLISLCHPDKHNGKSSANSMTTRLIAMRRIL